MRKKISIPFLVAAIISITIFSCSNEDTDTDLDNFSEIVEQKSQVDIAGRALDRTITTEVIYSKDGSIISEKILSIKLGDQVVTSSSNGEVWHFYFGQPENIIQSRGSIDCDPPVITSQTQLSIPSPLRLAGIPAPNQLHCLTTSTQTCFEGGFNADGVFVGGITITTSTYTTPGLCQ